MGTQCFCTLGERGMSSRTFFSVVFVIFQSFFILLFFAFELFHPAGHGDSLDVCRFFSARGGLFFLSALYFSFRFHFAFLKVFFLCLDAFPNGACSVRLGASALLGLARFFRRVSRVYGSPGFNRPKHCSLRASTGCGSCCQPVFGEANKSAPTIANGSAPALRFVLRFLERIL